MIICPKCGWEIPKTVWTVEGDLCADCEWDTNKIF